MKYFTPIVVFIGIVCLIGVARAQEAPAITPDSALYPEEPGAGFGSEEPGPPGDFLGPGEREFGRGRRRGPGRDFRGLKIKTFRRDVRKIGEEMRRNYLLIQSLQEELEMMEAGVKRAEVKARLDEVRRRQALLKLELARKKVTFTGQARDLAESRYRESVRQLEEAEREIEEEFPGLLPPDPVPKEE